MTVIHILAGLLSLLSGALAFSAAKGSPLHRNSGRVFALAMLVMSGSAVIIATWLRPNLGNIVAGLLTMYLVASGVSTLRPPQRHAAGIGAGLMLLAGIVGSVTLVLAYAATQRPSGTIDSVPAAPLFLFGVVGLVGAGLDLRLLRAGSIGGKHRIARHLWRMGFAMWIATTSAFVGQAKHFPEPLRQWPLLVTPTLLVTGFTLYWLIKTLRRRSAASPKRAPERSRALAAEPALAPE